MFVPKHGNLGRTKAGWLHKVFATHVFPIFGGTHVFLFVFPSIIFFLVSCSKGGWLAPNPPLDPSLNTFQFLFSLAPCDD